MIVYERAYWPPVNNSMTSNTKYDDTMDYYVNSDQEDHKRFIKKNGYVSVRKKFIFMNQLSVFHLKI
jgi:tRNA splicing ligase